MIIGSFFDGFDDVAQKLRFDCLQKFKDFGLNHINQIADLSNPAIDQAFPPAAKNLGLDMMMTPNTGDWGSLAAAYNPNTNIVAWMCQDDANIAGVDATKARIAQIKPVMRPGQKTCITVGKGLGADHAKFANLADWYHIQNYTFREGLKKYCWTDMLLARKNCTGTILHAPYLGKMTPLAFGIKANNMLWMIDGEYVPLAYNKAGTMAALCAGANGIYYYTLFYGIAERAYQDPTQKNYHFILERPDLVAGYKDFHDELNKYAIYFDTGVRVPFENGDIVGATFTLPNGDWIRVEVDTIEFNPSYRIIDSKDAVLRDLFKTPAGTAKVIVSPTTVQISGNNMSFTQ